MKEEPVLNKTMRLEQKKMMDLDKKLRKKEKALEDYFVERYLKNTCFNSVKELLEDKTLVQVNVPRALIACDLVGVWKGLNDKKFYGEKIKGLEKEIENWKTQFLQAKTIIDDVKQITNCKSDDGVTIVESVEALKKFEIFYNHVRNHFIKEHPDWKVKCKICDKTYEEIIEEEMY